MAFVHTGLHEPGDRFRYELIEHPEGMVTWRCDLAGIRMSRSQPDEMLDAGQWLEYDELDIPVLSLVAGRTQIRAEDLERMRHARAPVSISCYPNSGHSLHLDEPERFLAQVIPFFGAG